MPIGLSINVPGPTNSGSTNSSVRVPPTVIIPYSFSNGVSFENYINTMFNRNLTKTQLGKGVSATVYKIEVDKKSFLVREQKHIDLEDFRQECLIIRTFADSPYVMKIYGAFFKDGSGYMLLEHVPGRTMSAWLHEEKTKQESERFRVYIQLLKALKEIHSRGFVHLDIKPANIWIPTNESTPAFFLDFGLARLATNTRNVNEQGTRNYMSEERTTSLQKRNYFALGRVIGQYNDLSYPTRKTGGDGFGTELHITPTLNTPVGAVVELLQRSERQTPDDFDTLITHLTRPATGPTSGAASGGGSAAASGGGSAAATRHGRRRRSSKKMTRRTRRRRT